MNKTRFEVIFFKKKRTIRRAQGPLTYVKAKVPELVEGPTHYNSLFLRIFAVKARVIGQNGRLAFQSFHIRVWNRVVAE